MRSYLTHPDNSELLLQHPVMEGNRPIPTGLSVGHLPLVALLTHDRSISSKGFSLVGSSNSLIPRST